MNQSSQPPALIRTPPPSITYRLISYLLVFPVFRLLFQGRTSGNAKVPLEGALVVVANHGSHLDPPLLGHALGRPVAFMAKAELFRVPILGPIIRACGAYPVARGASDGGADAVTVINTCQGMAVDWRRRRPLLGNVIGGLSGPAIKPIALRCVHQIRRAVDIPIIGVGGIMTIDDCMEFFVTGASAVQVGTASFAEPVASMRLLDELPAALAALDAPSLAAIVGSLQLPAPTALPPDGKPC